MRFTRTLHDLSNSLRSQFRPYLRKTSKKEFAFKVLVALFNFCLDPEGEKKKLGKANSSVYNAVLLSRVISFSKLMGIALERCNCLGRTQTDVTLQFRRCKHEIESLSQFSNRLAEISLTVVLLRTIYKERC